MLKNRPAHLSYVFNSIIAPQFCSICAPCVCYVLMFVLLFALHFPVFSSTQIFMLVVIIGGGLIIAIAILEKQGTGCQEDCIFSTIGFGVLIAIVIICGVILIPLAVFTKLYYNCVRAKVRILRCHIAAFD